MGQERINELSTAESMYTAQIEAFTSDKSPVETGRKEDPDFCLVNSIDCKWKINGGGFGIFKRATKNGAQLNPPNVNHVVSLRLAQMKF